MLQGLAFSHHTTPEQSLHERMEKLTELGECSTQTAPVVSQEAKQNTDLVNQVFTMFKGYLTS